MPSTQTDFLFKLIKSMSKAEKRSFKLYANRISGQETALFIQLFDVLDKQQHYEEDHIFQRVPEIKRSQLSNLKRHLYKELLKSLRLISAGKQAVIDIHEQIDHAHILYSKGLYMQSLKILERAKRQAMKNHQDILHLEILQFIKKIENRHITRSGKNRASELAEVTLHRSQVVQQRVGLTNLALNLYGLFIKIGHIRNEKDKLLVDTFFAAKMLDKIDYEELTFYEKIYYNQCHIWYSYILQNFLQHYRYCGRILEQFQRDPDMKLIDPDLYLRSLHSTLSSLYYLDYHSKHEEVRLELEEFHKKHKKKFNTNTEVMSFLYRYPAAIHRHFMEGSFSEGLTMVPRLLRRLDRYDLYLDQHHLLSFYYKIACLYFGSGDPSTALDYLNRIINMRAGNLREDIQCYARILQLICHYEMGNRSLLEYLTKSVLRFLKNLEAFDMVEQEILRFLRRELYSEGKKLNRALSDLLAKIRKMKEDPYQSRSFLYLDIEAWLESKIEGTGMEVVAQRNFAARRR